MSYYSRKKATVNHLTNEANSRIINALLPPGIKPTSFRGLYPRVGGAFRRGKQLYVQTGFCDNK